MKNYVVIPYKDKFDLTAVLLGQLFAQNEFDRIFLFDNGSSDGTKILMEKFTMLKNWSRPGTVEIFSADGMNIHEMWNAGLLRARDISPDGCNIAVLNNDITIGPEFLSRLARELRANGDVFSVCANYDKRPGTGVQTVTGTCGGRYDGTGGFAGFAFMLRGEDGYLFPEEFNWWYGDDDLVMTARANGLRVAVALEAACEHADSATGKWNEEPLLSLVRRDRELYMKKWKNR